MSGIFGIYNRNGKSVDKKTVDVMLDAMSYWGPDEKGTWIDENVVLGHTMLWNTPESKFEHQPGRKEHLVITMDARLDNRDELAAQVDLPDKVMEEIPDSDFIMAAYKKWGEKCPKYLLGDFAFAIWDVQKQQLFCARDHMGIKLLHYYLSDELFVFSNDIEGVLAHEEVPKRYDDKTISLFLRDQGVHTKRSTFFEKIKKLPPATTLLITSENIVEEQYWSITDIPKISFDSYDTYVERLKELFDNAVEVRLRTDYPVVSHLSGGIDSSPIAVLAARKLQKKDQQLTAFNWVDVPEKEGDYEFESWSLSRRIADDENIIHKEFSISPKEVASFYDTFDFMTKGTMYYWREYLVQDHAKEMNARTILTGWGGDEFISYNGYGYESGLFWQGKIVEALQYLYAEKSERKYSWIRFARRCAREMFYPLVYKLFERTNDIYESDDYMYVKKDFVKVMKKYQFKELPFTPGVRKRQHALLRHGHLQARVESWELSAFSKRMEYRYPLLDKRLVEFALGIPEEMFAVREGHRRFLWRKSVEDLLPHDIVWLGKYAEIKIEAMKKKSYSESLRIWYGRHKHDQQDLHKSSYINYAKILLTMKKFDFDHSDPHSLRKVVVALLLTKRMSDRI
ncbi:asparagine synthase-related protein [Sulfurovum sp.]|uniref:asparagine synthase-related protein n=1 Tax=Sulfurovum sp. TaxID=1969726 RepID=UPI0035692016